MYMNEVSAKKDTNITTHASSKRIKEQEGKHLQIVVSSDLLSSLQITSSNLGLGDKIKRDLRRDCTMYYIPYVVSTFKNVQFKRNW